MDESFGASGRSCGRGIVVVMTDESYSSVNVALVGLDGSTLSGSFISSASAEPSLNAALSGDTVVPTERMSGDIVLVDRFPNAVLTFVDVATAEVRGQVPVRTGFNANPQDVLSLSDGSALVSRLESNRTPGDEEFDEGDDLLQINGGRIQDRFDLSDYAGATTGRARPGTMVRVGERIFVALTRHSPGFQEADEAGLLVVRGDTGEPVEAHPVRGLKNCSGLGVSPDGAHLAVSCAGLLNHANGARPPHSGIVVYRIQDGEAPFSVTLRETFRLSADEVAMGPFGFSATFASSDLLWVSTYGALEGDDAGRPDRILSIDLATGDHEVLLTSDERPFNLASVRCMEACGVCFVADAERGLLHRFSVAGRRIAPPTRHVVENDIGLPPRLLGQF